MPRVAWYRRADANNTRALANLAIGAVYTGAGSSTTGAARVDLLITCVQIGAFTLDESDDGAIWTTTETWPTTAGLVNQAMSFPLSRAWWRIVYTQGAAAGNVGITATLDPRPINSDTPVQQIEGTTAGLGNTVFARPLGSRGFYIHVCYQTGAQADANQVLYQRVAGGGQRTSEAYLYQSFRVPLRSDTVDLYLNNGAAGALYHTLRFVP